MRCADCGKPAPTVDDTITSEYTIPASEVRVNDVLPDLYGERDETVSRVETGNTKTKIWVVDQTKQGPTLYVDSDEYLIIERTEPTEAAKALMMIEVYELSLVKDITRDIGGMYKATLDMQANLALGRHALNDATLTRLIELQAEATTWWEFIRVAQNKGSIAVAAVIIDGKFRENLVESGQRHSTSPVANLLDSETTEAMRHVVTRNWNFMGLVNAQRVLEEVA